MDIKKLTTKPKLVQLEVDTPEVIDAVGESITFYMLDHLDLATYFDFYKLQQDQNINDLIVLMRRVVLDSEGKPAIAEDEILPVEITLAILNKINEFVGKSKAKVEKKETGGTEQN